MVQKEQTTWDYLCHKCGHIYKSPLPLLECRHKCTPISRSTEMLPVNKDDHAAR